MIKILIICNQNMDSFLVEDIVTYGHSQERSLGRNYEKVDDIDELNKIVVVKQHNETCLLGGVEEIYDGSKWVELYIDENNRKTTMFPHHGTDDIMLNFRLNTLPGLWKKYKIIHQSNNFSGMMLYHSNYLPENIIKHISSVENKRGRLRINFATDKFLPIGRYWCQCSAPSGSFGIQNLYNKEQYLFEKIPNMEYEYVTIFYEPGNTHILNRAVAIIYYISPYMEENVIV